MQCKNLTKKIEKQTGYGRDQNPKEGRKYRELKLEKAKTKILRPNFYFSCADCGHGQLYWFG